LTVDNIKLNIKNTLPFSSNKNADKYDQFFKRTAKFHSDIISSLNNDK